MSAQAVAAKCTAAQQQLQALPNPSPIQGADRVLRIRSENDVLRRMVDAFATVQPRASTPAAALKGWTADWTRVIDARGRYANALDDAASTPDKKIKFVLPASSGVKPVTEKMNDFVRENHPDLDACFTDGLALERVEGPREYKKVTA